ncbi:MAG TPA: alpha/beta fold hydrolase [Prolixibacteraceae bacterium]|nr:alpha/beta fold hydrolase [Prolixibacteraceae bacterium]
MKQIVFAMLGALLLFVGCDRNPVEKSSSKDTSSVYEIKEGYVDANGVLIYYKIFGKGQPLVIVHGGPGASHDYFLPYLVPLARKNQLIFIDERGSGRSQKIENVSDYTVENMADDVEAVRQALGLGKISLIGSLLWWRSCPGIRFEIPGKPFAPDSVQYLPQHEKI